MTSAGIFLQTASGLVVLDQTPYDTEAVLQEALAMHPEVIAGPTTAGTGGRLLLVNREIGVPSAETTARAFSLDHLFVDSDCVPVFVEVKRASDTRIRREVVGQMLDYAANGVRYWPIEDLQRSLRTRAEREKRTVEDLIGGLTEGLEVDEFWQRVEENLRQGRVRLLFVADELPQELARIIEFLNEQMTPAEVLGVELRQFAKDGHIAYVPRVVGQTEQARTTKARTGQQWTEEQFLAAAAARCSAAEVAMMQRLLQHVREHGSRFSWGRGVTPGVAGWYSINGQDTGAWVLNANSESPSSRAYLVFYLADVVSRGGLSNVESAAAQLSAVPSMTQKVEDARSSGWRKYPSVYLADVVDTPSEDAVFRGINALIGRSEA